MKKPTPPLPAGEKRVSESEAGPAAGATHVPKDTGGQAGNVKPGPEPQPLDEGGVELFESRPGDPVPRRDPHRR